MVMNCTKCDNLHPEKSPWCSLLEAVSNEDIDSARAFLTSMDDSDKKRSATDVLHLACERDAAPIVALILDHGADINRQLHDDGHTPLARAVHSEAVDSVRLLLERGADYTLLSHEGHAPIHSATFHSFPMLRLLIECGVDVNLRNSCESTPLYLAAYQGAVDVALFLLDNGADPTIPTWAGGTPLQEAVKREYWPFAQLLLDRGVDINIRDYLNRTPLEAEAFSGHLAGVRFILERGADPTLQGRGGESAIHTACEHFDVVRLLLESGRCNVNARTEEGATPLHVAAMWGAADVACLLIDNGADPTIRDNYGQTARDIAQGIGDQAVLRAFAARHRS